MLDKIAIIIAKIIIIFTIDEKDKCNEATHGPVSYDKEILSWTWKALSKNMTSDSLDVVWKNISKQKTTKLYPCLKHVVPYNIEKFWYEKRC